MPQPRTTTRTPAQRTLLSLLAAYRRWISPLLPSACRFYPSCSSYAAEAIEVHGVVRGMMLAGARLARCHPWCEGGVDPVPPCGHDHHRMTDHNTDIAMKGRA